MRCFPCLPAVLGQSLELRRIHFLQRAQSDAGGYLQNLLRTAGSRLQSFDGRDYRQGFRCGKGLFVDGLARVGTRSSFRLRRYTVRRLDAGATCVLPAEVEFFFGFKEPEIYVSKDLDKDSCRFSVVIRHEQVHQRINKLVLEYFLPLISDELQKAVRDVKAVKVSSPEQGEDGAEELMKYYQARLGPLITTFEKVLEKEQDKLDNLTNYQMEWELCRKYESEHPAEQTE